MIATILTRPLVIPIHIAMSMERRAPVESLNNAWNDDSNEGPNPTRGLAFEELLWEGGRIVRVLRCLGLSGQS